MEELFAWSPTDVRSKFQNYLSPRKHRNQIIVVEKAPKAVGGLFDNSDLIFVFNSKDEMVLVAERLSRKDYNWLYWVLLQRRLKKMVKKYRSTEYQTSYTAQKEYVDITFYKGWWYDWAESLLVH